MTMTIKTNMFDKEQTYHACTVFTMRDSVHYEVWHPLTHYLIIADPTCVEAEHKNCDVQILTNSVNGNVSYGWKEVTDED